MSPARPAVQLVPRATSAPPERSRRRSAPREACAPQRRRPPASPSAQQARSLRFRACGRRPSARRAAVDASALQRASPHPRVSATRVFIACAACPCLRRRRAFPSATRAASASASGTRRPSPSTETHAQWDMRVLRAARRRRRAHPAPFSTRHVQRARSRARPAPLASRARAMRRPCHAPSVRRATFVAAATSTASRPPAHWATRVATARRSLCRVRPDRTPTRRASPRARPVPAASTACWARSTQRHALPAPSAAPTHPLLTPPSAQQRRTAALAGSRWSLNARPAPPASTARQRA